MKHRIVFQLFPEWDASPMQDFFPALNLSAPICAPMWSQELRESRVFLKNTTQYPQPGLPPRLLDPGTSSLNEVITTPMKRQQYPVLMCIHLQYRMNKGQTCLLMVKIFHDSLNHLKILPAHQFCDFK